MSLIFETSGFLGRKCGNYYLTRNCHNLHRHIRGKEWPNGLRSPGITKDRHLKLTFSLPVPKDPIVWNDCQRYIIISSYSVFGHRNATTMSSPSPCQSPAVGQSMSTLHGYYGVTREPRDLELRKLYFLSTPIL